MKRLLPILLALLLLMPLAFCNDDVDEQSMNDFFTSVSDEVEDETSKWVSGQVGAHTGVVKTFDSVFEAFGPGQCGDDWIDVKGRGTIIGTWVAPAVFVLVIVSMGIAIVYMLGQFLSSPNLIALAKEEIFQVGVTVLRIVFIGGMLLAGETWFAFATAGGGDVIYQNEHMIDAAMAFSRLMVKDMVNHYSMLIMYNMVIHTIYSSTMWFGVTWRAMYSFNLGPVLKPLIDIVGSALQFLSLGISEWMLHLVTLCMLKKWAWGLFIPLSILLRSFPYTRNAGEALFALVFALVVFYPFMFLFDYEVFNVMKGYIVDGKSAVSSFMNNSGILGVVGLTVVMMFLMAGVFIPFFLGGALTLAFELIRGAVFYIVIMSLLLPFINIFVTLTIAKESAAFFKVDVSFLSFLKVI